MLYRAFEMLDHVFGVQDAKAHCDIPCGIYDPHAMEIAALTVIRMIDLMNEAAQSGQKDSLEYQNSMARYIAVKEEHGEILKREARVIFGDYFKKNHVEQFPELPELTHKILQGGSKGRQTVSREAAMETLSMVNRFAEIFWQTKNIPTKRVKAPYKPEEEMVVPVLG